MSAFPGTIPEPNSQAPQAARPRYTCMRFLFTGCIGIVSLGLLLLRSTSFAVPYFTLWTHPVALLFLPAYWTNYLYIDGLFSLLALVFSLPMLLMMEMLYATRRLALAFMVVFFAVSLASVVPITILGLFVSIPLLSLGTLQPLFMFLVMFVKLSQSPLWCFGRLSANVLPGLFLVLQVILLVLFRTPELLVRAPMTFNSLYLTWVYLRFYEIHPDGRLGNASEEFEFATMFPSFLHGPVKAVGTGVHQVARALRVVPRDRWGSPQHELPLRRWASGTEAGQAADRAYGAQGNAVGTDPEAGGAGQPHSPFAGTGQRVGDQARMHSPDHGDLHPGYSAPPTQTRQGMPPPTGPQTANAPPWAAQQARGGRRVGAALHSQDQQAPAGPGSVHRPASQLGHTPPGRSGAPNPATQTVRYPRRARTRPAGISPAAVRFTPDAVGSLQDDAVGRDAQQEPDTIVLQDMGAQSQGSSTDGLLKPGRGLGAA